MYRSMDFQRHTVVCWESVSVEQQLALDTENQARAKKVNSVETSAVAVLRGELTRIKFQSPLSISMMKTGKALQTSAVTSFVHNPHFSVLDLDCVTGSVRTSRGSDFFTTQSLDASHLMDVALPVATSICPKRRLLMKLNANACCCLLNPRESMD